MNLKFYLTHKNHNFQASKDESSLAEVGEERRITLQINESITQRDFEGLGVNCDYENVYGDSFRSSRVFGAGGESHLIISGV